MPAEATRPRILVIEDQTMLSEMLVDFLDPYYDLVVSPRVSTSMDFLDQTRFELVLLDWGLPDGDSTPIAERVQRDGIPVIWMSGNTDAMTPWLRGKVLRKPFSAEDLLDAISAALKMAAHT